MKRSDALFVRFAPALTAVSAWGFVFDREVLGAAAFAAFAAATAVWPGGR